jgi:hypothetical protein
MEKLGEYDIEIKYRPGNKAVVPDALSRLGSVIFEPGWRERVVRA